VEDFISLAASIGEDGDRVSFYLWRMNVVGVVVYLVRKNQSLFYCMSAFQKKRVLFQTLRNETRILRLFFLYTFFSFPSFNALFNEKLNENEIQQKKWHLIHNFLLGHYHFQLCFSFFR